MSDEAVRAHVRSSDVLTAPEFFSLVRCAIGFREQAPIPDPLNAAVSQISSNPAFAQSRLLKRILVALVSGGEFRRSEAAALDASTCKLVIALLELRSTGTRSRQVWVDAAAAAEAAIG